MDTLLTALGLLLVAMALTLLSAGPRTWLVALAQGLGVQAVIGGVASAAQMIWIVETPEGVTLQERVITGVQGLPFNAAGWSGRTVSELASGHHSGGAVSNLNDYLPIAMIQMAVIGAVFASRKMKDEGLTDPVQLALWALLIANSIGNLWWPWWSQ